jgi:hypothetical protein
MSRRKREKRSESAGRVSSHSDEQGSALYLYCIGEAAALAPLVAENLPSPVEDEGPVELVEQNGLAAVSSRVGLKDYNEEALQAHLKDAAWMALRAMRHERVADYFAKRASVVPLRFGVIYLDRSRVEKMLTDRSEELRAAIRRLDGREEWGVNIFCDRKALMEAIASISPRLRELNEQAASASPGQSYLVRKKMDAMRKDEAREEVRLTVERIEGELRAKSDAAVRLRLLRDEAGEHGELVGKLAFLVERSGFEDFRRAAERAATGTAGAGFRLELTGPWPAYNFVGSNEE